MYCFYPSPDRRRHAVSRIAPLHGIYNGNSYKEIALYHIEYGLALYDLKHTHGAEKNHKRLKKVRFCEPIN
jgi:hypothetical protein